MAWDVSSFVVVLIYLVLLAPLLFGVVLVVWSLISPPEDRRSRSTPLDMDAPSSGDVGSPG